MASDRIVHRMLGSASKQRIMNSMNSFAVPFTLPLVTDIICFVSVSCRLDYMEREKKKRNKIIFNSTWRKNRNRSTQARPYTITYAMCLRWTPKLSCGAPYLERAHHTSGACVEHFIVIYFRSALIHISVENSFGPKQKRNSHCAWIERCEQRDTRECFLLSNYCMAWHGMAWHGVRSHSFIRFYRL